MEGRTRREREKGSEDVETVGVGIGILRSLMPRGEAEIGSWRREQSAGIFLFKKEASRRSQGKGRS